MISKKQHAPTDVTFVRARKPGERALRYEQILTAARRLIETHHDLTPVTLTAVARAAGMAKSNIYRYFESREAVLLAVLADEWANWIEALPHHLQTPIKDEADLAQRLSSAVTQRPALGLLTSAMASVLEHNVTQDAVAAFKAEAAVLLRHATQVLYVAYPRLPEAAYAEVMHNVIPYMAGLWPLAHPSPTVCEVMQAEELKHLTHDFERDLTRTLTLWFRGLVASARGPQP